SPSRPRTMYIGFDRVLRSDDRGYHWRTLSPALVRVVDTITLMGQPVATRLPWGETAGQGVTAISESPLDSNVVYAGASDGVPHWTRNGGTTRSEERRVGKEWSAEGGE